MERPPAKPGEISSRSSSRSSRAARRRVLGANPPSRFRSKNTLGEGRCSVSLICLSVKPLFQPRHTIARSAGVNRLLLDMQHLPDSIESKGVASTGLHHPDPDFLFEAVALALDESPEVRAPDGAVLLHLVA